MKRDTKQYQISKLRTAKPRQQLNICRGLLVILCHLKQEQEMCSAIFGPVGLCVTVSDALKVRGGFGVALDSTHLQRG